MESKGTSISVDLQGESMLCIITETNLENVLLVIYKSNCFSNQNMIEWKLNFLDDILCNKLYNKETFSKDDFLGRWNVKI